MKLKILFLLLPALLLASCSGEDDGLPGEGTQVDGQIRFEIGFAGKDGPQSRAATDEDFKTEWETGDEIGIFAVKNGEGLAATGNYIHNVKLTRQGDDSWSGDIYWPNTGETYDFYAYYPYNGSMTDPTAYTFSVMADQSGVTDSKSNYNLSDLMTAKATDQSKGAAVSLQFSHALSLVQVEVKREVNVPLFDETDFTVTLTGALPDVTLGWDNALTGTGTAADIVMRKVDGMPYTYRALVPAQELAADAKVTFVQNTADKKIDMEYQGVKSAEFTAANTHKYSVTLGWGINPDHEYAVGDVYPHVGPAVGIVFYIENNGKNGKVVGLQEKSNVAWADWEHSNILTGVDNTANGFVNMGLMAQYIDSNGKSWSNFPVFAWVHGLNDAGEDYSDANATGVWYLPSIGELQYLYCAWNGKDPETWNFGSPVWGADNDSRTNFNDKLTAAGGTGAVLGTYYYWSSSEDDFDFVQLVGFNVGDMYLVSKDLDFDRARCVLAF